MALGGLTTLDPNALSATKLKSSGMTAQEVGYKRKAFEQDLAGKLMADQTKQAAIQQKEKAAQAKVAEWKPEYAAFSHTDAYAALLDEEKKLEAKQYADFKAGIGGNPDDATSEAARERRYRRFELDRKAKASQEAVAYGQKMMDSYRARPFDYADDTEAKITQYISNPAVMDTGKLPDLLEELYDLGKATNEQLGFLKPSMSGNATTLPDGSVNTWTSEKVIPGQVMAGIDMVLQNEHAWKAATRAYENLLANDPERAAQVAETAAKNNIPMVKAMVFDAMNPVYSYTKYKEGQTMASEGGAGVKADERASLWLGKVLEGYMDGTYGESSDQLSEPGEGFGTGEMRRIVKDPTTLVGWKWDAKDVYDPTAGKNIKVVEEIKDFEVDPQAQVFRVTVGPAKGDGDGRVEEIRFDEAESKLVPRISGNNKDQMRGIGIYDIAAEKTGEGTRKGAGAQNIVKTPQSGPYVPGKQSTGPYIPGR